MASKQKQIDTLKTENEELRAKQQAAEEGQPSVADRPDEQAAAEPGTASEPQGQSEVSTDGFKPRIYWSRADMYRIANYVAEIKRSGNIDQREISIEFKQHIRTAYTQHEADYIEGHKGYGVECKRVNSMEEATALTFQQDLERGQVRSKPITTAIIDDEETTADKPTPVNRQTMMSEAAAGQG